MPWCETCEHFYNPNTLRPDGTCPGCEQPLAEPSEAVAAPRAPWHFKVLVVAIVGYLGWRLIQGIDWAIHAL